MSYSTPGVYVEEVTVFPPSVAQVETAIPAFIGYTEKAEKNGEDLTGRPTKIKSPLDYTTYFGRGADLQTATVTLNAKNQPTEVQLAPRYYLFDCIQMFFANGGGDCYIVSVGGYNAAGTISNGDVMDPIDNPGFLTGLKALEQFDEPTLLLAPDAVLLKSNDLYTLQQAILTQCVRLQDRFGVFDLLRRKQGETNFSLDDSVQDFRNRIGINGLKYGAAYTPYLYADVPFDFVYGNNVAGNRNLVIQTPDPNNPGGFLTPALNVFLQNNNLQNNKLVNNLEEVINDIHFANNFTSNPFNANPAAVASFIANPFNAKPAVDITNGYNNINTIGEAGIDNKIAYISNVARDLLNLTLTNNAARNLISPGGQLETIVVTLKKYDMDYYDNTPTPTARGVFKDTDFPNFTVALAAVIPATATNPTDAANIYTAADGTPGATANDRDTNSRPAFQTLLNDLNTLANQIANIQPTTILDGYATINTVGEAGIDDRITYLSNVAQSLLPPSFTNNEINNAFNTLSSIEELEVGGALETIVVTLKQYDMSYYDDAAAKTPRNVFQDANFPAYAAALGAVTSPNTPVPTDSANIYTAADGTPGATANDREVNARNTFQALFDSLNTIVNKVAGIWADIGVEVGTEISKDIQTSLRQTNSLFDNIVKSIETEASIQPPSATIAGIYTKVDDLRGVHKAPANVSLNAVIAPTVVINHKDQESLNIDTTAGKSINAIRSFTGKGTLVWGARTLKGNDNEWRYISVRRFFNMVEESIKKSTAWAVFEPNDSSTWSLVRSMISNYLYSKWQEGALQGASPKEAYFVHIGEGVTFTSAEKLEGIMRVKIGMAVVRPAEFIELEFSHMVSGT